MKPSKIIIHSLVALGFIIYGLFVLFGCATVKVRCPMCNSENVAVYSNGLWCNDCEKGIK